MRDPTKWTHYSLADVDEDGSSTVATDDGPSHRDPNSSIALSFLSELRERRMAESQSLSGELDEQEVNSEAQGDNRRILFRPTRGTKRVRLQETEREEPNFIPAVVAVSDLTQCEEEPHTWVTPECRLPDQTTSSTFIARRQRARFSGRQLGSGDEDPLEIDEHCTSDKIVEDRSETLDTIENEVELEGDGDEEENEVVENNFLA